MKDSRIQIYLYISIEPLVNWSNVYAVCGPYNVRPALIHRNKCIAVRYKIVPIVYSYINGYHINTYIFFLDTFAPYHDDVHTRHCVCVQNGCRYHTLLGTSFLSIDFRLEITFFSL
jgi:hypothetical protein